MPTPGLSSARRLIMAVVLAGLLVLLWLPAAQAAPARATNATSAGHWYTVQRGDTWTNLSRRTGLSVSNLQAANPAHMHPPHYWLYVGHQLWIPASGAPGCDYWYTVQRGDSWSRVSQKTGVSIAALQRANPDKVRPPRYWLYAGESLWIPCHPPPPPVCQYYYQVQHGDSWSKVSRNTGVPIHLLQAANPGKVRPPRYWLYAGETLCIPDP